jgi:hypothetical protein
MGETPDYLHLCRIKPHLLLRFPQCRLIDRFAFVLRAAGQDHLAGMIREVIWPHCQQRVQYFFMRIQEQEYGGAAAVLGASTLTDSESEHELGTRVTPRLVEPGVPMGQAIQEAKEDLARTSPELRDVLLGWTLLGDPMTIVTP